MKPSEKPQSPLDQIPAVVLLLGSGLLLPFILLLILWLAP